MTNPCPSHIDNSSDESERLRLERLAKRREQTAEWVRNNKDRVSASGKARYEKNKEKLKAAERARRLANPEKYKAARAKSRERNRERNLKRGAAYRDAHREELARKSKEYADQRRELLRQKKREYNKRYKEILRVRRAKYRQENLELIRKRERESAPKYKAAKQASMQRYRARKQSAHGRLSKDIVPRLMALQKGKCACCRESLRKTGKHIDHVMPLSAGGHNTDDNVQLLCPACNCSKNARHPIDFMQSRGFLL
jgi:5-methylcytosine-specific restriction endonuclease McrA